MTANFAYSLWRWLFEPNLGDLSPSCIWTWWQKRRVAYNIIAIFTAVASFVAFEYFCVTSGLLAPGEDAEEPMGVFAAMFLGPIGWNLCYCLGPMLEIALRKRGKQGNLGPQLFKGGLIFSIFVLCVPSGIWAVIWTEQVFKGHAPVLTNPSWRTKIPRDRL